MNSPRLTLRYPVLSFLELEAWIRLISPKIVGCRVSRLFVPETNVHPESFFKKEWVLELNSQTSGLQLYFSLRSQASGMVPYPVKYFKPSQKASRSGFDLSISKALEGSRVTDIRVMPGERTVVLEFKTSETFELHLQLIPSTPIGVLLQNGTLLSSSDQRDGHPAHMLTDMLTPSARILSASELARIPNRLELVHSIEHYRGLWESARLDSALALRRSRIEQALKTELASISGKIKSLETQLTQSQNEPDWNYFGSLLQTHFYAKPEVKNGAYELLDYETNQTIQIPADPKLQIKEQLERYFHAAKRNKKRLSETALRIEGLAQKKSKLEAIKENVATLSQTLDSGSSLALMIEIEKNLGISAEGRFALKSKEQKKLFEFSGKEYQSKEGLTILVGRNLTENLELTFKIARGNDLWLHVKGRPGSHTVILLPQKRTASLDTLLDAATLCILHSGGKEWGKTEVDYTHRKHVKKIKNQTEVSYTHNKTLSVTLEADRLKRLYAD